MVFDVGSDLAVKLHEVVDDDANDMETVSHDPSVGEPFFNEVAVGRTEVDADHLNPLFTL